MGKVMLEGFECERCGHKWVPRITTEDTPTICPKCKSPYWDKPKRTQGQSLGKQITHERLTEAKKTWNKSRGQEK